MFKEEILDEIKYQQSLQQSGALAMVVQREAPTSGKPGDAAVITSKGEVKGWIGGGCTRGIVIKEALEAMAQQTPRLVRIQTDDDATDKSGVKNYKMTCMSGGSLEVYIEPIASVSNIFIFGRSHIAKALCEIGSVSGFRMHVISDFADESMFPAARTITRLSDFNWEKSSNQGFVVVCTQGEDDELSLKKALGANAGYTSFVASRKKANSVLMALKREGLPHKALAQVKTPAGLNINAKTPEEVAISILAQIVEEKRTPTKNSEKDLSPKLDAEDLYINPVCQIPVKKSTALHVLEHLGQKIYFCCDGCKDSFEKEPERYLPA